MKTWIGVLAVVLALAARADEHGSFKGEIVTKWLNNGREMELLEDFAFTDPTKVEWSAPKGSIIDGASIPQPAWSIIGGPFEGKYRPASVIHDVACDEKKRRWQDVHFAFYNAMLAGGVPIAQAQIMYAAVYLYGPRWEERDAPKKTSWHFSGSPSHSLPGQMKTMDMQSIADSVTNVQKVIVDLKPLWGKLTAEKMAALEMLIKDSSLGIAEIQKLGQKK